MNAPLNSDSQLYAVAETGRPVANVGYAPSVPISVYRELAAELKTTQSTLDALTQQNQQLLRQNQLLRTEIHRFVQSAEQLGHFAGVMPAETHPISPEAFAPPASADLFANPDEELLPPPLTPPPAAPRPPSETPAASTTAAPSMAAPTSPPAAPRKCERPGTANGVNSAIVPHPKSKKRDLNRPPGPGAQPYRLFTEQPEEARPLSKVASRSDFGNLWLATTILLVVVSAFGAGFLIMRPLLNR
ncbi:hypothetical protein [Leptolyngbya iicbica]|uniref:Uncharacterized protein n=2 Tax=Cyanophyceae TaxID=3028117 RepID=A0A4Q7E6N2_9CYAN|nr:hypothetical protein [Leptolyngbya sp. LK]RZM76070.1 hypothetical protein DYY88_19455 [Leptolyngbya sp. LK]